MIRCDCCNCVEHVVQGCVFSSEARELEKMKRQTTSGIGCKLTYTFADTRAKQNRASHKNSKIKSITNIYTSEKFSPLLKHQRLTFSGVIAEEEKPQRPFSDLKIWSSIRISFHATSNKTHNVVGTIRGKFRSQTLTDLTNQRHTCHIRGPRIRFHT